jgi:hypothetical protein
MLGVTRDRLGRFAGHSFTRRVLKYTLIAGGIWFAVHMFLSLYTIQHSRGIYGVVSKATYNALIEDHAEANVFRSIPDKYLTNIDD